MSLVSDSDQASGYLEHLQARLWEQGDHSQDDDITSIMAMLDSPLFRQLLTLQESLTELKQVANTYPVNDETFEISLTGELILNMPPDSINSSNHHEQPFSESMVDTLNYTGVENPIVTPAYNLEFQRALERASQGRQIEIIKLFKPENSSLGFSVVGPKRMENQVDMGIYVQEIQPVGIAARDGRLRERDQILAIDGQPIDISHQEAIRILQSARGLVELIVARGPIPQQPDLVSKDTFADQQADVQVDAGSADMVLNTEWTQIEVIDLINDGTGLGFGIIGGRSTGVVVKTILPGGVADLNGRLHSGDHVLQIGDVNVRGMGSEQVASVLRQSGSHVRLIVARPVLEPSPIPVPQAPIVPTHQLEDHIQQINRFLEGTDIQTIKAATHLYYLPPEFPEVEYFDVNLMKDDQGLGITIAGYVGRENSPDELCGIFVKSIGEGSAAAQDGRIQVNDQIIQVDNQVLTGFSNHEAVEVLRKTGQMVHLKLARYQHGPKFEKLQQYLSQPIGMHTIPPYNLASGIDMSSEDRHQNISLDDIGLFTDEDYNDISLFTDEDYTGELLPDTETAIRACWEPIIGEEFEVVVAQLSKFKEGGGLGISLEGTVDVENGKEVRPHHYIRSILPDGPVGVNGRLMSGDELLEVNGKRLLGLNHKEVVGILKELPQNVRLVCARRIQKPSTDIYAAEEKQFHSSQLNSGVNEVTPISDRLVKAKSEMALASVDSTSTPNSLNKMKSRSLEPLTNLAMWSGEPVVIELRKGDKGLGFSILDYQDPGNPTETVIVIRSLVPGGVAQQDGRLVPGDRLIFVNEDNLENANLDEAVQALKGASKGIVRIGVAKPLPLGNNAFQNTNNSQNATFPLNHQGYGEGGYHFSSLPQPPQHIAHSAENLQRLPEHDDYPFPVSMQTDSIGERPDRQKSNRDSFYESDEDTSMISPNKPVKPVTTPRTHIHKNMASGSYENDSVVLSLQQQQAEHAVDRTPPTPQPRTLLPDYDTFMKTTQPKTMLESAKFTSESPHSVSPVDYENALPTYEEATAGDLDDMFTSVPPIPDGPPPPVPLRSESHTQQYADEEVIQKEEERVVRASPVSDEPMINAVPPSDKKVSSPKRTPPPIPPKPTPPKALLIQVKPKDTPPPLPASSPPQLDPVGASPDNRVEISPRVPRHRQSDSLDGSFSSSEPAQAASDLNKCSPCSSPRTMSPGRSPMSSPSLRRTLSGGSDSLPPTLEKKLKLKKGKDELGMTVEAVDKGINGCVVKTVLHSGAVGKDGRIQKGDYIVAINNESLRRITNAQARAIIRRATLLGLDIEISYISSEDAAAFKESAANQPAPQSPTLYSMMPSPKANLSPLAGKSVVDSTSSTAVTTETATTAINTLSDAAVTVEAVTVEATTQSTTNTSLEPAPVSPRQKSLAADGSPATGNQTWGPQRMVELSREPNRGLGISIVGGRVDLFHVQQENTISGIFIKHVLDDSPAGKNGTLKTGDRILEVDGKDLRNASHDQAVEIIRNASTPVKFLVQSLTDQACPTDLEIDTKSVQSYEEAFCLPQQTLDVAGRVNEQSTTPPAVEVVEEDNGEEDEYGYTLKRIQRRYGDLTGALHLVDLKKAGNGLGISLAGNKDRNTMSVFVAGIQPESVAWRDGRIHVGDELLEVNGQVLYGRSHLNASAIIKGLTAAVVKIVLVRRQENLEHMAVKPLKPSAAAVSSEVGQRSFRIWGTSLSPQDVFQVFDLQKGASGLGFAIVEENRNDRQGIYVRSITPGGVAAQDGQLSVSDQILEVGDRSLTGVHYDKAIEILRNSQGTVRLKVRKCGENNEKASSGLSLQQNTVFQVANNGSGESSTDPAPVSPSQQQDILPHDPFTCPIIPGKETSIEIEKGRTGLGLSIVGGADTLLGAIIIHEVYEDGAAARDGRLWAGDQVLD
ncbi:multiple PDZ domain protein-like, partial [Ylistrum balloti]|uniref:multiple PDZ domain protein-like n=1 Tax=Ylistrum balloti TaxID=509963 RepID=UPI002905D37D